MENLQLARAVDPGGIDQLFDDHRVEILLGEEHAARAGNRRQDQGGEGVGQAEPGHVLEEADDRELQGDHDQQNDEVVEQVATLEMVDGDTVGGEEGEVDRQDGGGGRDEEAVEEAAHQVEAAPDQHTVVVESVGAGEDADPLLDFIGGAGGIDHQQPDRDDGDHQQHGQEKVDQNAVEMGRQGVLASGVDRCVGGRLF